MSYNFKTRNGPTRNSCASPSNTRSPDCALDTVATRELNVLAGAQVTVTLNLAFTDCFIPMFAQIHVIGNADATQNLRATLDQARVGACNLDLFSQDDDADSVVLVPDAYDDPLCCYGRPVNWPPISSEALSQRAQFTFTNISANAADIYLTVAGYACQGLPAGMQWGKPCGVQAM